MKSYDEILKMFDIEDEKVYFNNKGSIYCAGQLSVRRKK